MNQRLVVKSESGKVSFKDLETFLRTAQSYGADTRTEAADYSLDNEGNLRFSWAIPDRTKVLSGGKRVIRIKGRDARRRAIDAQLAEHRQKKADGTAEGYVPPVGRTSPPRPQKIRCPDCGTRKNIINVGGVKSIKPHIIKGDPCPGSGKQPVGIGKRAKEKK